MNGAIYHLQTEMGFVEDFRYSLYTVSTLFEPRGSIFQNGFLGGVLLIFDLPGVVIETGFY